ncbi:GntR family transcriptional regulator [Sediminispirochaeta bajacaliforniensis]|uniref:GntR family transcriptional regulator n=1 Tax=Sediminispirochaeta bajacaliforniensis TaxID=148 RepID=UPI00039F57DB|nr:GntR family transcriptional regulator [Sediminispirochaeta bajacaliforniensis]
MKIDRTSHVPVYYQIKESILAEISSGRLKPGDKILSEPQLKDKFGVSRMTARNAVTELVNEGYLVRKQGYGTYVQKPRIENTQEKFHGFKSDMEAKGFTVFSRILESRQITAPDFVASALELEQGTMVFWLKRLRFANNEPIVIHESYVPTECCPDLLNHDFEKESLYTLFTTTYKKIIETAVEHLEATAADAETAALLAIEKKAPILFIDRTSYLKENIPFEYSRSWYRGDRYMFDVTLQRQQG